MRFLILLVIALLGLTRATDSSNNQENNTVDNGDIAAYNNGDLLIRYLMAIRYAQLENFWANYNNRYQLNQVPIQPAQTVKPFVKEDCKQVGERCVYHEDCCSFACLSYLARCVSR